MNNIHVALNHAKRAFVISNKLESEAIRERELTCSLGLLYHLFE